MTDNFDYLQPNLNFTQIKLLLHCKLIRSEKYLLEVPSCLVIIYPIVSLRDNMKYFMNRLLY